MFQTRHREDDVISQQEINRKWKIRYLCTSKKCTWVNQHRFYGVCRDAVGTEFDYLEAEFLNFMSSSYRWTISPSLSNCLTFKAFEFVAHQYMTSFMIRSALFSFKSFTASFDCTSIQKRNKISTIPTHIRFSFLTSTQTSFLTSIGVLSMISVDVNLCPHLSYHQLRQLPPVVDWFVDDSTHWSMECNDGQLSYGLWQIHGTEKWQNINCTHNVHPVQMVYRQWMDHCCRLESVWCEWNDSGWSAKVYRRLWNRKIYTWILFERFRRLFDRLHRLPLTFVFSNSYGNTNTKLKFLRLNKTNKNKPLTSVARNKKQNIKETWQLKNQDNQHAKIFFFQNDVGSRRSLHFEYRTRSDTWYIIRIGFFNSKIAEEVSFEKKMLAL